LQAARLASASGVPADEARTAGRLKRNTTPNRRLDTKPFMEAFLSTTKLW
jgi:hypothetical protein